MEKVTIKALIEKGDAIVELSTCKLNPAKTLEFLRFKEAVQPTMENYNKVVKEAFDECTVKDDKSPSGFKFKDEKAEAKFNKEQEELVAFELDIKLPRIKIREIHSSISPNTLGALLDFIIFE